MERALITIRPSEAGWVVTDDGDLLAQQFYSKYWAIQAAEGIACVRHMETGEPTGVKLQMECGDTVMFGTYG